MYSVVLLMAVAAGSESADFGYGCHGGWGCYGGYSAVSYGGCYGGGYSGCYGGGYSSCYGGYSSCYSYPVSYGCYGGYSSCYSYPVSSCYGCYGSYPVYSGCCGTVYRGGCCGGAVMPGSGGAGDKDKDKDKGKGKGKGKGSDEIDEDVSTGARGATIVVSLPADARLTIDGTATVSKTARRTFTTPALEPGKVFAYNFQATWKKDGKDVVVSKKVKVEAGKTSRVELTDEVAVASK